MNTLTQLQERSINSKNILKMFLFHTFSLDKDGILTTKYIPNICNSVILHSDKNSVFVVSKQFAFIQILKEQITLPSQ